MSAKQSNAHSDIPKNKLSHSQSNSSALFHAPQKVHNFKLFQTISKAV